MPDVFEISTFTLEGQHIREYERATSRRQEDVLELHIKRYRPLDNLIPSDGDVTIIGAHANGFPKELYEPLWEEIYRRLKHLNHNIRAIWIADIATQGASGVMNEHKLGNDPSGLDHARDLLHVINHFRAEMPRPLVGIGHSMGGCQLTQLCLIHPRLLSSLVLIEPFIGLRTSPLRPGLTPAALTTLRTDIWPSRAEAEASFRKSSFYKRWHPAVFRNWLRYGLRELPTNIYPVPKTPGAVTLTTSKHQEAFMYLRPNYKATVDNTGRMIVDRATVPDLDPEISLPLAHNEKLSQQEQKLDPPLFYRPEAAMVFRNLPHVRPPILYIFGGASLSSTTPDRASKVGLTGTGVGGSGGYNLGKVKEAIVEGGGHLIPMEQVGEVAGHCAGWLGSELSRIKEEDRKFHEAWNNIPFQQRSQVDDEWINNVQRDDFSERLLKSNI